MWYSFETNELGVPYVRQCEVQDRESYFPTVEEAFYHYVDSLSNRFRQKVDHAKELVKQYETKEELPKFVYFVRDGKLCESAVFVLRTDGDICYYNLEHIKDTHSINLRGKTWRNIFAMADYYETPDAAIAAHAARLKYEFEETRED